MFCRAVHGARLVSGRSSVLLCCPFYELRVGRVKRGTLKKRKAGVHILTGKAGTEAEAEGALPVFFRIRLAVIKMNTEIVVTRQTTIGHSPKF